MDAPRPSVSVQPSPTECHRTHNTAADPPISDESHETVEYPPQALSKSAIIMKKKEKKKKKKKRTPLNASDPQPQPSSSSSSSCCTTSYSSSVLHRGIRVSSIRRNPRILIGSVRNKESDVEALALPLGMSIAAVLAQVLERKETAGGRISVDNLSMICSLAVRESLANVFGDKFDCFVRNFEKSFRSTLMTLRLINESSQSNGVEKLRRLNEGSYQSEVVPQAIRTEEQLNTLEEGEETMQFDLMNRQLTLHERHTNQQLTCVTPSVVDQSMLGILEKSAIEQARSNELKKFEIGLIMKKLKLKETQLALNSDLNILERWKLSMGISKASFKAERFKNQLEDTRHAELLKMCIDCLVAGLLVMLGCLSYGVYVYSHKRITEATASCTPTLESKSWWIPKPMASLSSGLHVLRCQVQVLSRMLFGALMIVSIAYLLLQRSATSKQTMPVTFIILLLGVACGFAGKLCMDTLGGSGYHWLLYWEALCCLHFFSNVCTSLLFVFLYGPINVSQRGGARGNTVFPYWIRRLLFYATVLLVLPLLCGFMPFAGPGEWKDHFSSLVVNFLSIIDD